MNYLFLIFLVVIMFSLNLRMAGTITNLQLAAIDGVALILFLLFLFVVI